MAVKRLMNQKSAQLHVSRRISVDSIGIFPFYSQIAEEFRTDIQIAQNFTVNGVK